MSHTPGPWRVEPDLSNIGKGGVLAFDGTEFSTSDGYEWCYMRIEDAHLIAAAPELLAALKSMVQDDDRLYYGRQPNPDTHGARAAIAKAEGK